MSGRSNAIHAARMVVRCSRVGEGGPCAREQAIALHDDAGVDVRVAGIVSAETNDWLSSFGWSYQGGPWLCPFCAEGGLS